MFALSLRVEVGLILILRHVLTVCLDDLQYVFDAAKQQTRNQSGMKSTRSQ